MCCNYVYWATISRLMPIGRFRKKKKKKIADSINFKIRNFVEFRAVISAKDIDKVVFTEPCKRIGRIFSRNFFSTCDTRADT